MQLTPLLGTPVPSKTTKLRDLGDELLTAFSVLEQKLVAAGLPPAVPAPVITAGTAAARDAVLGVPGTAAAQRALQDRGVLVVRTDLGTVERYYAAYDATTNPGGASPAGWYPLSGPNGGSQALALATGWSAFAANSHRLKNGWVFLSLGVSYLSNAAFASGAIIGTLPAGRRPAETVTLSGIGAGALREIQIRTNGDVACQTAVAAGGGFLVVSGSFPIA